MFSQVTPKAIAHLHWKYFAVFMSCDACAALTFYFFYPYVVPLERARPVTDSCSETKGKTLEEMAEIFGDQVAFSEHIGLSGLDAEHGREAKGPVDTTKEVETNYVEVQVGKK